jgi:hypothetical protein
VSVLGIFGGLYPRFAGMMWEVYLSGWKTRAVEVRQRRDNLEEAGNDGYERERERERGAFHVPQDVGIRERKRRREGSLLRQSVEGDSIRANERSWFSDTSLSENSGGASDEDDGRAWS